MTSVGETNRKDHDKSKYTKGFMIEKDIWPEIEKIRGKQKLDQGLGQEIKKWCDHSYHDDKVYGHDEPIGKSGKYTCNTIVDEWFKWFLTTPRSSNPHTNPGDTYGLTNSFLHNKLDTLVHFTTAAAFRDPPDFKTITITEKDSCLLVPVYNSSTSRTFFNQWPGTEMELGQLNLIDLAGVYTITAKFDGEPIVGCCVVRNEPEEFPIADQDNVIDLPQDRLKTPLSTIPLYHAGFWLLIRETFLTSGDHLLTFSAKSRNYEMDAKILISVLC
jgi:hypothetical protein